MNAVAPVACSDKPAAERAERLERIFSPRSVAVIGVTATPATVPYDIFANILHCGFRGTLYPVAPGKKSICSVKAYRYVVDIEEPVDLAVIVFPAEVVDRALEQCGKKGIPAAVVISAGFRETGPLGAQRERRLQSIIREHNIALIGPNCLGVINTDPKVQLNASFARRMPAAGRIAFLSQSGALCTAVLDYAQAKGIGFSKFISFGNKAGVNEIELIEYLHEDPQTDVILLYLEDLPQGRALVEVASRITKGPNPKPILAIKSGRTPQGADAAASHTGSLAGEDAICDAAFRDAGILRATSIEELFNAAVLYAHQPLGKGERVAIVTNAGGPGVMATDAAVRLGLSIPRFEAATTERLRRTLPATANLKNPVDVIGDARADRYQVALEAVLADPNVDQVLVILTPQSMTDIESIARCVCSFRTHATKPIACSFMGALDVAAGIHILQESHIPHYILPEWACKAMADVQQIRRWRNGSVEPSQSLPVDRPCVEAILAAAGEGYLREDRCLDLLAAYGLPVPRRRFCQSELEAVAAAEDLGYPVVLQLLGTGVIHKSELGAVALNLVDAAAIGQAYDRMHRRAAGASPSLEVEGVLVRKMIPAGHELILGGKRDPSFGPVLLFGTGGIYVECLQDVTFALAPVSCRTAAQMLQRIRTAPILRGTRGTPPADIDGIKQCLLRLGQLLCDFPQIQELDINPLIAGPQSVGNQVADARIRIGKGRVEI